MQKLKIIQCRIEMLAKKEYSLGGHIKDIQKVPCFFYSFVSPESGCMSVVHPWQLFPANCDLLG